MRDVWWEGRSVLLWDSPAFFYYYSSFVDHLSIEYTLNEVNTWVCVWDCVRMCMWTPETDAKFVCVRVCVCVCVDSNISGVHLYTLNWGKTFFFFFFFNMHTPSWGSVWLLSTCPMLRLMRVWTHTWSWGQVCKWVCVCLLTQLRYGVGVCVCECRLPEARHNDKTLKLHTQ